MTKIKAEHLTEITPEEVAQRLTGILKAFGIEMLITDARVSAVFPDGAAAFYAPLTLNTLAA